MLKKILIAAFFFFSTLPPLFAGSFYVVPMFTYDRYEHGDITFYGLAPRIALGYGDITLDQFYLDIEVFASPFQSLSINSSTPPPTTTTGSSVRPDYSFGGQLLPGMLLDYEVKVFAILGIVQTGFKSIGSKTGYQLGAGIDWVLNDSWTLRGEYLHSRYHDTISGDQGALGLVYRFC